mgnify:FL=1
MDPIQALEQAHLNWDVNLVPLTMPNGNVVPDKRASVRSDTGAYLGTVGTQYTPLQNKEQAEFIRDLIGGTGTKVECCGALFGGSKTFWTVRVGEDIYIKPEDSIQRYLIVANGHDGSLSFKAFWSPIRVVCNNTLSMSLNRKDNGFSIRHKTGVKDHVEEAREILGLTELYYKNLTESFQAMVNKQLDAAGYKEYLESIFPITDGKKISKQQADMIQVMNVNFESGRGANIAGKTVWGAMNSVTEYIDHQKRLNKTDDVVDATSRHFESVLYGQGQTIKQKAYDKALALV